MGWKAKRTRFPLIIKGARQTGKTYLVEEFGRDNFARVHKFDFELTPKLKTVFQESLDPERILED